jgi:endonuclease/exonuclease/phosphatase family metal-dependent hydrolase
MLRRQGLAGRAWTGVLLAGLAPALLVAMAAPATATAQYRFLQFNTAGNVRYGGDEQAGVDIGNSVLRLRPHVVTINEICLNQAQRLDGWLSEMGYPMQVTHRQTIPTFVTARGIECRYGNALASVGEGSQRLLASIDLPSAGLEQRALTCADVVLRLVLRGCVTHLTNGTDTDRSEVRTTQISAVSTAGILRPRVDAGAAAVLGGDMNVSPRGDSHHPDQLDPVYQWLGSGPFVEAEGTRSRCDPVTFPCEPTLGSRKLDYVFLDARNWSTLSATTSTASVSDHRLLKGYAWH